AAEKHFPAAAVPQPQADQADPHHRAGVDNRNPGDPVVADLVDVFVAQVGGQPEEGAREEQYQDPIEGSRTVRHHGTYLPRRLVCSAGSALAHRTWRARACTPRLNGTSRASPCP